MAKKIVPIERLMRTVTDEKDITDAVVNIIMRAGESMIEYNIPRKCYGVMNVFGEWYYDWENGIVTLHFSPVIMDHIQEIKERFNELVEGKKNETRKPWF